MREEHGRITVVMPAYNAAQYIRKAIVSVQNQSYKNWELVIIENGSTDHTTDVCKEFLKDERIVLLKSEKGVSYARNKGIEYATGNWLIFLDADDWLPEYALEYFINSVNNAVDLVIGDYDYNSSNSTMVEIRNTNRLLKWCLSNPTQYCNVTGNLYSVSFLKKNGVYFNSQLTHAEDSEFFIRVLLKEPKVIKLNKAVYHVYYNPDSTVRSNKGNYIEPYKKSILTIKQLITDLDNEVQNAFHLFVLNHLLILLVHNIFAGIKSCAEYNIACEQLSLLVNDDIFNIALKTADLRELPRKKKYCLLFIRKRAFFLVFITARIRQIQNRYR